MSANNDLRDAEIRHQIMVSRLSSATLRKLRRLLDRADAEIVDTLIRRGGATQVGYASARLSALLDTLREINRDVHVELGKELRSELRGISRYELQAQEKMLREALLDRLKIKVPTTEMLDAVVNSRPFQGKLLRDWVSELDQNKARRLRDAIRQGVVQGESIEEIVRRVRGTEALRFKDGILEIGKRGAEALVRTAVSHTVTAARDALFDKNRAYISKEQWVSTLDSRVCLTCGGLDGRLFDIGTGIKTPAHISCRCIRVPVLKSWDQLGLDDLPADVRMQFDGLATRPESFQSWLRRQSNKVQDDALGPARAKLFREGQQIDSFTNRAGDALTLEQLRARAA